MSVYLLGIDAGTSFVKSVIFDTSGREIATARRATPLLSRIAGGSEVDMREAWALTAATIREVLGLVNADAIAAVGVSGTACGFWAIDDEGQPVRDAILWNDGRAADVLERWEANGFVKRMFEVSGNAAFPGYPLSTLRWLHENEPAVLSRARWLLYHKDWLRFNLTGTAATDITDASYFPGDIHARTFSPDLLREAGLESLIDKLPPVYESHSIAGYVSAAAAAQTGLRAGTPVAAGAVDVASSLLGGGAYRAGQACSILGTSFLNTMIANAPSFDPPGTGVQAAVSDGRWARSLVNTSGTLCMDWMEQNLAITERQRASETGESVYQLIENAVKEVQPGARGLIFLPYLNTAGIVSPFAAADARGQFFGLSSEHTRLDMMRAVYEGVALAMKDCFSVVAHPVEEVILVGGGARSAFWPQLFADVTGKRILIPEGTEFGARGAAILAGVGAGVFATLDAAMTACIRPARVFSPQPALTPIYDTLYPLYRHLYQTSREAWRLRSSITKQIYG